MAARSGKLISGLGVCSFFTLLKVSKVLCHSENDLPVVIHTWPWPRAAEKAWDILLQSNQTAVDAVEAGCTICEVDQCYGTVGYGGSPDENGETTLDAMIMDGKTHKIGAVACLRRVKSAISVARAVMDYTKHTMLAGELASDFAREMGFKIEDLHTNKSKEKWKAWRDHSCQPNYRQHVTPAPSEHCGPYKPTDFLSYAERGKRPVVSQTNHDTIGMIAIDRQGHIAGGTSTNGATHKVPGRVGDSPIPGAGCYVDQDVGGAAATGDGDVMMRFLPSMQTVENMRHGMSPTAAAKDALQRIVKYHPRFSGALVAIDMTGEYGAVCVGFEHFSYTVRRAGMQKATIVPVKCTMTMSNAKRLTT